MILWQSAQHEALTRAGWSHRRAEAELEAIVADADTAVVDGLWPGHPLDDEEGNRLRTLYIGSAGMIWGLHRLGELVRQNSEHETWELMWGSPGTMLAAGELVWRAGALHPVDRAHRRRPLPAGLR